MEKLKTLEKDKILADELFSKISTHVTNAGKLITEFNFYNKDLGLRVAMCKSCAKENYNKKMKDPEYRKRK